MVFRRLAGLVPRVHDDPREIPARDLWPTTASVRVRRHDKEAFLRLRLELQVALGQTISQTDAFTLLLEYAEGDTAAFLDWAAGQAG